MDCSVGPFAASTPSIRSYHHRLPSLSLSPAAIYRPVAPSAASTSSMRSPAPDGSYYQSYPQSLPLSPSSTTMYRPVAPSAASTSSMRSPAPGGSYYHAFPQSPPLSPSSATMHRPVAPSAASASSMRSPAPGGSYYHAFPQSSPPSPSSSRSSKSFICNICFAKLGAKQSLQSHIRTHGKEKKFICSTGCGTTFPYSQALRRHLREGRCPHSPRAPPN
ncbi:hypothetical protein BT96DRAFT_921799 [Gymnopus androsaceus JB14]|uniref:C2H2-type domain-containing protein n=1 Tax=Gymnopus androsaceus JB14 TaxID=1447944 RepID=A0A6A4HHD5_9AGAR|nr:hypothetical protein BT96DRAFT_921799 [Gymnopus androsaceus JB14]